MSSILCSTLDIGGTCVDDIPLLPLPIKSQPKHYLHHKRTVISSTTTMSTRLSQTIASLDKKRSVHLQGANIDDEGASAFADALTVNTSVTEINLRDNYIGAEGASSLANALKVNTSVTQIDLLTNGIGNEGAAALADALKVNTSV
jgi:hypothetical protein